MARKTVAVLVLSGGLALAFGSCGSDDCQECSGSSSGCPTLTKQCPGFTASVQQCSGTSDRMCCVTNASEISCSSLRAAPGLYSVVDGAVYFSSSEEQCGLHVRIDPVAAGWLEGARTPGAQDAAIQARMSEVMPLAKRR